LTENHRSPESPANVLIVDDDGDICEAVKAMLEELGIEEIQVARNGEEAVTEMKARRYDLVFLDLLMPRLDGFGVLTALRDVEEESRPGRVVVMSAHVRATAVSAMRTLGADDLLVKPFELEDLAEKAQIVV